MLIALTSLVTFSCSKDDVVSPVTPPDPDPVPPTPKEVLLGINPTIAGIEPVTRGIITNLTDNDKIGLFLTDGELGKNYQKLVLL